MRKRNAVRKNLLRTIKASLGRYIAIVGIIALGAGIFVGLVSTKADMVATGRKFMEQQNMFDLRLISTYGWTQEDVDAVEQMAGVSMAEGQISLDAIASLGDGDDNSVYKLYSIPQTVTTVKLLQGRMPQNSNECLLDGQYATEDMLGMTLTISSSNDDATLDALKHPTYTVVGLVGTPLYMDMSRGSTSVGNGTVTGFAYLPLDAFTLDVYTEISVVLEHDFVAYTAEYDNFISNLQQQLEPYVQLQADGRYASLRQDAEDAYREGKDAYDQGLADYEQGKQQALQELEDALQQLLDGQKQLDENRVLLQEGLAQLQQGQLQLEEQSQLLLQGRLELEQGKTEAFQAFAEAYGQLLGNYTTVRQAQEQVRDGLGQLNAGIAQMEDGIRQLEEGILQIQEGMEQLELGILLQKAKVESLQILLQGAQQMANPDLCLRLEEELATAEEELENYLQQKVQLETMLEDCNLQLAQLQQQYPALLEQRESLLQTQAELDGAMHAIEDGMTQLETTKKQTESQFAAAQAQLEAGAIQLQQAQAELDAGFAEVNSGLSALEEAQAKLDEGYAQYEQGKLTAEQELQDAWMQLQDAAAQLADARSQIDSMEAAKVYLIDRNSNAGYLAVNNNSDIVAAVSRVFPAFFLLVASLVCITTMTRMVEEERTQIGTFKAIGYGSGAIVRKYLLYAGSAAILGCGLGTILGSWLFPNILWKAYQIIMFVPERAVLIINWPLCLAVVGAYTVVVLLVTWYCCYRSLQVAPAELIRPKAPTSGKKIWMEYLPLWRRLSFLNKVMLRNVFRYRQRMLMMLVGIGGCTALLLTGYGLRDSVVGLVEDQFTNICAYDLQVYFSQGQTLQAQEEFLQELRAQGLQGHFLYQTSMELHHETATKDINVLVSQGEISKYMYFRQDGQDLPHPGVNEAMLSVGLAEQLGLRVGDTIVLRSSDMQRLEVKLIGIFHNNVANYILICPETLQTQWGSVPLPQMLYANVAKSTDVRQASAEVGAMADVINVTVNEDLASQLDGMLGALDTIIFVVVICAGALAVIVLYNLTNINITERIREIATIKVLGFRAGEAAAYVFKENLLLTVMGTLFGLPMGYGLLQFVLAQVRIDLIWISSNVATSSYLIAVGLTLLSAVVVDFLLYFKLEKINMAEALKSVE